MAKRVLVVDDEPGIADSMVQILGMEGYECRAAFSGREASRTAADFKPHMVITDVIMPGMSGIELAKELRHMDPGLPIVLLSGNAATTELLPVEQGATNPLLVFPKPYSPRELLRVVAEMTAASAIA